MNKLVLSLFMLMLMCGQVLAADNLLIRLEDPKTPTNDQDFAITFVVLDILGGRSIEVVCEKQYEGGSMSQFYSTTMTSGGNTGSCPITSSIVSQKGNYTVTARATAGADTSVDTTTFYYNNEIPDAPNNYSKNKIESCKYEIKFKTADDAKTAKVEIYRSTETSFGADDGSRIAEVGVGPNTEKVHVDTVPDCNKTYYYALRAFSSAGNGSGLVGDKEIKLIEGETSTTDTTEQTQAIPVAAGAILGVSQPREQAREDGSEKGLILGVEESSQSATLSGLPDSQPLTTNEDQGIKWGTVLVLLMMGIGLIWGYRALRQ